jgi:hypothetical protein
MQRWLTIGLVLFIIVIVLLIVGLAATLLVVFAYGLGRLFTGLLLLPLETGQATLLALISIVVAAAGLWRILTDYGPSASPLSSSADDDDEDDENDDEDKWDEDELDEDDEDDEDEWDEDDKADEPVEFVASIPRWRQPIKPVRFEGANPNGPCPCGSGRKYKNCHGRSR